MSVGGSPTDGHGLPPQEETEVTARRASSEGAAAAEVARMATASPSDSVTPGTAPAPHDDTAGTSPASYPPGLSAVETDPLALARGDPQDAAVDAGREDAALRQDTVVADSAGRPEASPLPDAAIAQGSVDAVESGEIPADSCSGGEDSVCNGSRAEAAVRAGGLEGDGAHALDTHCGGNTAGVEIRDLARAQADALSRPASPRCASAGADARGACSGAAEPGEIIPTAAAAPEAPTCSAGVFAPEGVPRGDTGAAAAATAADPQPRGDWRPRSVAAVAPGDAMVAAAGVGPDAPGSALGTAATENAATPADAVAMGSRERDGRLQGGSLPTTAAPPRSAAPGAIPARRNTPIPLIHKRTGSMSTPNPVRLREPPAPPVPTSAAQHPSKHDGVSQRTGDKLQPPRTAPLTAAGLDADLCARRCRVDSDGIHEHLTPGPTRMAAPQPCVTAADPAPGTSPGPPDAPSGRRTAEADVAPPAQGGNALDSDLQAELEAALEEVGDDVWAQPGHEAPARAAPDRQPPTAAGPGISVAGESPCHASTECDLVAGVHVLLRPCAYMHVCGPWAWTAQTCGRLGAHPA